MRFFELDYFQKVVRIMEKIIERAEEHVRKIMAHDCTGHDYLHVDRVRKMALAIHREEKSSASIGLVELVALLHDIGDAKLRNASSDDLPSVGSLIRQWGGSGELAERVETAIGEIGFKGGFNAPPSSPEVKIVQDADRLDALGAIGIARAFAFGGHAGQKPFDPAIPVRTFNDEQEYRKRTGTTVNHFHEKLFRLPELLNTSAAKRLAERRVAFMRQFLCELRDESGVDFCR